MSQQSETFRGRHSFLELLQVLACPVQFLESLALQHRPRWAPALFGPMVVGIIMALLTWQNTRDLIEYTIRQAGPLARPVEIGLRTSVITNMVTSITLAPLLAAAGVATTASVYGLFRGHLVPFQRLFAIAIWASVPETLGNYLVSGILTALLSTEQLVSLSGSATSLAFLASGLPAWSARLLGALDLFYAWFLVLFTAGYAHAVQRPVSRVWPVAAILVLLRMLWVLVFR